jgi:hypothetical protein
VFNITASFYVSLLGQLASYEQQQNEASAGYIKAREEIESIKSDVRFKPSNRIEKQEKRDQILANGRPKQAKALKVPQKYDQPLPAINLRQKQAKAPIATLKKGQPPPPMNVRSGPAKIRSAHRQKPITLPPINADPKLNRSSYLLLHEERKSKMPTNQRATPKRGSILKISLTPCDVRA